MSKLGPDSLGHERHESMTIVAKLPLLGSRLGTPSLRMESRRLSPPCVYRVSVRRQLGAFG